MRCKYHSKKGRKVFGGEYTSHCIKKTGTICPKNTNWHCNITPAKVKDKVIKAWFIRMPSEGEHWEIFSLKKTATYCHPVTITIKHADYEKLRRKGL